MRLQSIERPQSFVLCTLGTYWIRLAVEAVVACRRRAGRLEQSAHTRNDNVIPVDFGGNAEVALKAA